MSTCIFGLPAVTPLLKAGSVKILAVSSAERAQGAPEIPTVAEVTGFSDFDFTLWQGFFAPKGTPPEVIARLNREINQILADPATRQKLVDAGDNVTPLSLAQFATFVKAESDKYEASSARPASSRNSGRRRHLRERYHRGQGSSIGTRR